MPAPSAAASPQHAADAALALLASGDAARLGGALVVGPGPEEVERWLAALRTRRGARAWRVLPTHAPAERLDGTLDVAATLASGRTTHAAGLLAEARGGTIVLARADAAPAATIARLASALDDDVDHDVHHDVHDADESTRHGARAVVIAAVVGDDDHEQLPAQLADRLAVHVRLPHDYRPAPPAPCGEPAADDRSDMRTDMRTATRDLWAVADALGVRSPRAVLHAVRAARALAVARGRAAPGPADLADAVQLTLAPRATQAPPPPETDDDDGAAQAPDPPHAGEPPTAAPNAGDDGAPPSEGGADDLADVALLIAAARAALPPELLAAAAGAPSARGAGRAGADGRRAARAAHVAGEQRGRLVGVRRDRPRGGRRLALVETLRAAVPWQRARGRRPDGPLEVRAADLRVERRRRPLGTTTVVVVDASGSAALGRLAEAKGAVELLLAESYARRDRVALVAFRGARADVLLSPTRALARARRAVTALPAGGGTPLASAVVAASELAAAAAREGSRPAVVFLTDGRANVALDGTPGRPRARDDARSAARALAASLEQAGGLAVVVDTSARGDAEARALADGLRGRYVRLPAVDARAIHARVRTELDRAPAAAGRGA